jgi:hypothetical protein
MGYESTGVRTSGFAQSNVPSREDMIGRSGRYRQDHQPPQGQSLVEFGLVLPLLLVLLLGIADLGRVFASAITTEAAARNAAEAAAQEYLQLVREGVALGPSDYDDIHSRATEVACDELVRLPIPSPPVGGSCQRAVIAVCVHDGADPLCPETSAPPPFGGCSQMISPPWNPPIATGVTNLPYVEVRLCYQFDSIVGAPLGDWGTVWLQRENHFTVTDY